MKKAIKVCSLLFIVSCVGFHESNAKTLMCPEPNEIHEGPGLNPEEQEYMAVPSHGDIKIHFKGEASHSMVGWHFNKLYIQGHEGEEIICAYEGGAGLLLKGIHTDAGRNCTPSIGCSQNNPTPNSCYLNCIQ